MRGVLFFIIGIMAFSVYGKKVGPERARSVALSFLQDGRAVQKDDVSSTELKLVSLDNDHLRRLGGQKSVKPGEDQLFYLFQADGKGFVIISGDDKVMPVLGYSDHPIDLNDIPVNFRKWLDYYRNQIAYIKTQKDVDPMVSKHLWDEYEKEGALKSVSGTKVEKLLSTTWNQRPYYNDLCPQKDSWSDKAVTGCVATAMAQIMKYHNHPKRGQGMFTYFHSNNDVTYGSLSVNFGNTTYDWQNMPNSLNTWSSANQINAVATLMYHCGVSVSMNYSPKTSGAFLTDEKTQYTSSSEHALREFFGYNSQTVRGVQRENYTTSEWINLMKAEINASRPILYAGIGNGGGHAFVADGYDGNNFFHINWGWGGQADGFFSLDVLDPSSVGTGGGSGGYSAYQRVVIGIEPEGTAESDIVLFSDINIPEIYQLNEFDITVDILNNGDQSFTGTFAAALFDDEGNFIELIDSLTNIGYDPLKAGYYYEELTFHSDGLSVYPGNYIIGMVYKPEGENWYAVGENGHNNFLLTEIYSPFTETDIKLYDAITVSPSPLAKGEGYSVITQVANYGLRNINCFLGAGLYDLQGNLAQTLEIISDQTLEGGIFYDVEFNEGEIETEPGTYLLALVYEEDGSDDQYLLTPNGFLNPVRVDVAEPPIIADYYEDNNEYGKSYHLDLIFDEDVHWYYYNNLNIHDDVDIDYFKINLDPDYKYTIEARVHDAYNNEREDKTYSGDVIWAHTDRNYEWTDIYDDVMAEPYTVEKIESMYFGILPYFEGQTGTYSFELKVVRHSGVGVNDTKNQFASIIRSNNQKYWVTLNHQLQSVEVIDNFGRVCKQVNQPDNRFLIDMQGFANGIYMLRTDFKGQQLTQKFVIN